MIKSKIIFISESLLAAAVLLCGLIDIISGISDLKRFDVYALMCELIIAGSFVHKLKFYRFVRIFLSINVAIISALVYFKPDYEISIVENSKLSISIFMIFISFLLLFLTKSERK